MTVSHIKKDPTKTISWASGTSTEIFIYPPTGDFQKRDFLFRISSATVESEETIFTALPNIDRMLMVIEGSLTLIHADQHTKSMAAFDQDSFQGDWETKSKGRATNFNLMCKEGASGTLKHTSGTSGSKKTFNINSDFELFYLSSGTAAYDGARVEKGDCLVVERAVAKTLTLLCEEQCNFIQASIALKY